MLFENCDSCQLKPALCHGVDEAFGIAGCGTFDHKQCFEFGWTCLCNPKLLSERLREVTGFECKLRTNLLPISDGTPHYVPTLYHGFKHNTPLNLDWIAIPLYILFPSQRDGSIKPLTESGSRLRELFCVRPDTKIIVTGVGPDQGIEDFWGAHSKYQLLNILSKLNIQFFTVPNYSFFLNSTPLHYRYNRGRMLRVAERATEFGLAAILHLNALHEEEWKDFERLLVQHPEIKMVCLEFQTGYLRPTLGDQAFARLVKLRQNIGRPIHPIFVGGARYALLLGQHFESSTIIDAQPFMQTFHRKNCEIRPDGGINWKFHASEIDEPLNHRFRVALATYANRLRQRLAGTEPDCQREFPFRNEGRNKLKAACKQNSTNTLPLFKKRQEKSREIQDLGSTANF